MYRSWSGRHGVVSEAWSKFAKQDEKLDLTKAPSEYKNREEVVIMIGETHHLNKQRILPMERSAEGEFKGFSPTSATGPDFRLFFGVAPAIFLRNPVILGSKVRVVAT